jgi:hypothetical protein
MSETLDLLAGVRNKLREDVIDANDVYVGVVPEDAEIPYLVVVPGLASQEWLANTAAFAEEEVQVDCYDWTLAKALTLSEGVISSLRGYSVEATDVYPRGLRTEGDWRVVFPSEVTTTGRIYSRVSVRLAYEQLRQQET